ncbi:Lrp/AsnC family transcriptional regulator [Pedobacter panaciterrae]|uniref:Lrp/AsnC family transcriptional regulator n=1 Tax=Pedobacter panaciterrae TaxID=363849 RepID=A0ABU8NHV5_9SPHI|nr:Lrp/AsnC family transcriptional regulator [Pedobacter panaciterrae]NQX56707.1 Lrp/AsnC family transcriptional regulator [Pedobacter panaciterrae]
MQLDTIDLELLKILQHDATLTNKELAVRLHRSVAAIQERRRKLIDQGYIKSTVAILDRNKIDRGLITFPHVHMSSHTAEILIQFEQEVSKFDEVMECFQMSGDSDFILKVATRDLDEYSDFLRDKLAKLANVSRVNSSFVLRVVKNVTAYPI